MNLRQAVTWLVSVLVLSTSAPAQSLFLSELADPRQNYLEDRFIEIYNPGPTAIDLTGWRIVAVGNGSPIFTWNLSGSIAAGEALVAGDANTIVVFPVDFPEVGWSTSNATWNGKVGDGARLIDPSSTVVDEVVAPGTLFENDRLVRNPDVLSPSASYVASQWTATPIELATDASPGTHTTNAALPSIDGIVVSPSTPLPGQPVDVSADLTDTGGSITGAELRLGLSAAALSNVIPMAPDGGDTWITSSSIAGQTAGTTVYFEIEATSSSSASAVSSVQSYTIAPVFTIAEVQGAGAVSPFVGSTVRTSGVVTATFADAYVIQDGAAARSGMWVRGASTPAVGATVDVQGTVDENVAGFVGTTFLVDADILGSSAGVVPSPIVTTSIAAVGEDYEGVLVTVLDATCTEDEAGGDVWTIDDGSGEANVGSLGGSSARTLGTRYDVTGIARESALEPRDAADVVFVGDDFAPVLVGVDVPDAFTVVARFSEAVDETSAETLANYSITGVTIASASRNVGDTRTVTLATSDLGTDSYALVVDGVADLFGNVSSGASIGFTSNDYPPPVGYYASAEGLTGVALRGALHAIIDDHTVVSYTNTLAVFQTSDVKANGKVWDMYSDTPGATPPYEYTFGVDAGSSASAEGQGYNREHSWPRAWFGGAVSPMNSDLFQLYPTDIYMNSLRGSFAFGEVDDPDYLSQNGTKRGPNTYPGYTGTVFEPIDDFKGDFARSYFYMVVRYYTEDGAWPGGPMTEGADLLPWAEAMLYEWHLADPVSTKERARNQVLYGVQGNRNPFIDCPEFAAALFEIATSVEESGAPAPVALLPNVPNPFSDATTISFALPRAEDVSLVIYDVRGRVVRTLENGPRDAGRHVLVWDGRDRNREAVATGTYFYRMRAGDTVASRRMVLVR